MTQSDDKQMPNTEQLVGVRKKIKRIVDWQFRGVTNLYPKAYGSSINMIAAQILNEVKARRGGGECPECVNGYIDKGEYDYICQGCKGTGESPVVEKSILEWILIGMKCKEWESADN